MPDEDKVEVYITVAVKCPASVPVNKLGRIFAVILADATETEVLFHNAEVA